MPTTPYALVMTSLNGGTAASGAFNGVALNSTVRLRGQSTVGWQQQRFEVYSYPDTFPLPAGWTQDDAVGSVTGVPSAYYSTSATPADFTASVWGKYLWRLKINSNTTGGGVAKLTDDTGGISIADPSTGTVDVSPFEDNRFDTKTWAHQLQDDLRLLIAGGGGFPSSTVANSVLQRTYPPGTGAVFFAPLTEDQILSAFLITSFAHSPQFVELGQTVATPAFTASYNRTPAAVALIDTDNSVSTNETSTPTAFSSPYSFTHSVFNFTVTFTLSANETGGPTKTSPLNIIWSQREYYGNAVPATFNSAFVRALPQSAINTVRGTSFTATAGATERLYFCLRSALGTPTFTVGGFAGGFHLASTVSVTNAFGFSENYDVWESDNLNLGTTTVVVS